MSNEQSEPREIEVNRVDVPRRTVEYQRPTVEVEGLSLAEGFLVQKLTLEVIDGPDAGQKVTLEKPVVRIGADPLSDLVLTDPTVSRKHAEVKARPDSFELLDLDSTNGTFIDGKPVGRASLEPDQRFQCGRTHIVFSVAKEQVPITLTDKTRYGNIIGSSNALREIFSILDRVAPSELSVVIEGETGTGKELIAKALHDHSNRKDEPFVVFDCSAFPATLLESELFGHEKGAFSGAVSRHRGVFERADGGTIFFDELGEMDIEFQAKFLRVLETGDVRRVGGEKTFRVDVRVVAATNRNLEDLVVENKFRQDLFYRLAKVRFRLPALRDRPEDVPLLVEHFLDHMAKEQGTAKPLFSEEALLTLQAYAWPGNIRQLKNVVEKAVALCGGMVSGEYLRGELDMKPMTGLKSGAVTAGTLAPATNEPALDGDRALIVAPILDADGEPIPFRDAKDALIADFERIYLEEILKRAKYNISQAARDAQVDRRHLYRILKKHDLMDEG